MPAQQAKQASPTRACVAVGSGRVKESRLCSLDSPGHPAPKVDRRSAAMPPPRCLLLVTLVAAALAFPVSATFRSRSIPGSSLLKTVKLRIYGGSLEDYAQYFALPQADKVLNDIRFDPRMPTMMYFHGYTETPDKESVKVVMSAFIAQAKYNVIFVDWSKAAAPLYPIPLMLVSEVGRMVAYQLDAWHEAGALSIDTVYLVGHSLGGQAAGFAGKFLTKGKIPRITALDPALPGFNNPNLRTSHLSSSDALFVDVIHTDGGSYGVAYPTGHADFYPNGGARLQPGCPAGARILSDDDFCSHWRSWRFFAESLNATGTPFLAVQCPSMEAFGSGRCSGNKPVTMGYHAHPSTRGTFFLETGDKLPFAKGEAGITPSPSAMARARRLRQSRRRFFFF
ncbi:lipoprotein lipase-like [Thrips palmi]|uniref:Lipoprotein lipase-like n=1 Tax=Thrips palmi TaxID=161013 RepID=A0A6P8ZSF1_THRPL|nr:lipoprotein lipase-like [Thrips palmi]